MFDRLKDAIVLITGASAGIGAACAFGFAQFGSKLILVARRQEKLEQIRDEILAKFPETKIHLVLADVADQEKIASLPDSLPEDFRNVTILVNNAGLALGVAKTWENQIADIHTVLDTNVKSVLYLIKAFLPGMRARGQGHVINISSVAGTQVYPMGSIYCASKHALQAINDILRLELVDSPIRVSSINPGLVETEFSVVRFRGDAEAAKKPYQGIVPLSGADVADAVVYAASRPPHVQVSHLELLPTNQASVLHIHRESS
eukprot:TRINITY_DN899_c0_g2_i2.p1 TRINITY_DN899_c0_g2~~TRINITY_DN899_c0_g2_i2.p1  ORF type:complete len:261 (-),score=66.20 TRINITY_DN899_c0_g2_i2:1144-1926(-)